MIRYWNSPSDSTLEPRSGLRSPLTDLTNRVAELSRKVLHGDAPLSSQPQPQPQPAAAAPAASGGRGHEQGLGFSRASSVDLSRSASSMSISSLASSASSAGSAAGTPVTLATSRGQARASELDGQVAPNSMPADPWAGAANAARSASSGALGPLAAALFARHASVRAAATESPAAVGRADSVPTVPGGYQVHGGAMSARASGGALGPLGAAVLARRASADSERRRGCWWPLAPSGPRQRRVSRVDDQGRFESPLRAFISWRGMPGAGRC